MPPKLAKLAGLGAFGVVALFALLYLLVIGTTLPRGSGGMTPVLDVVTWIAIGLVVVAVAVAHVAIAKQLLFIGRGGGPRKA